MEDGRWKFLEFVDQALAGGDCFAQDSVDERADRGFSGLYGFVDRSVVRDVEDEDLAETDAEDIAGFGVEFALAEFCDPVIDEAAVAEDAKENSLQQSAVGGGEHASLGVAVDEAFGVIVAFGPGAEGGDGGLADVEVFSGHKIQLSNFNSQGRNERLF